MSLHIYIYGSSSLVLHCLDKLENGQSGEFQRGFVLPPNFNILSIQQSIRLAIEKVEKEEDIEVRLNQHCEELLALFHEYEEQEGQSSSILGFCYYRVSVSHSVMFLTNAVRFFLVALESKGSELRVHYRILLHIRSY